jgi:HD-like signal output (HDOD) protein
VEQRQPPSLAQVCEQAIRLPSAPSLMPRLISVLEDGNSAAEEIERIILVDPALTAATLRLANSAFFGSREPVETVAEAVIKLGQKEIYRLASLALVNRWGSGPGDDAYRGEAGGFCRHALCTALAAEVLAEQTTRHDPQSAYTAGLVCDIGKLAVAHACAAFFPAIRARRAEAGGAWIDAERAVLGYTHAEIGAHLLRKWRFPSLFVAAAEHCQAPAAGPTEARTLLAHLHAAKYVATCLGPGVADDGFLFELDEAFLREHGFVPEMFPAVMVTVLERASARLHERLSHGTVTF